MPSKKRKPRTAAHTHSRTDARVLADDLNERRLRGRTSSSVFVVADGHVVVDASSNDASERSGGCD